MTVKLEIAAQNEVKIDKGIPLTGGQGRPTRYPWTAMEVGDSFLVPPEVKLEHFRRQAVWMGRSNNRKFSVRKFEGGFRCWRIA